ncbi:MAG: protein O-GlcNAcase [Oscillospiraceae bacterium]|nr:protein O-GlcNAcase [Oscillospiraceae bacterium]
MIFSTPQKTKDLRDAPPLSGTPKVSLPENERELAQRILLDYGVECGAGGTITLSCEHENSRLMTYVEESRAVTDEKYVIRSRETKQGLSVEIVYGGRRALYYALHEIARRIKADRLFIGEIEDYPLFSRRGYIEGFYGQPWTFPQRRDMLRLMSAHRMNTYFYAPKDDEYHRDKWRELYPSDQLDSLLDIIRTAEECFVDLWFCIAPGLSMIYSSEDEFSALMGKLKQLYGIGVRRFGLLLDDIPAQLQYPEDIERFGGETVNAHIYLANRVYDELKALDRAAELTVCPRQYHGRGDEYFISKLGQGIEPDVNLFWTGRNICSQEITVPEAMKFIDATRHRPLYWDNFPVNDAEMFNEMHLGYIQGREPELYRYSAGLISNCMEFCEASKIPLLTVAGYLWNPVGYDPLASWDYALKTVVGEEFGTFKFFAEHLLTSCLHASTSPMLNEALSSARSALQTGNAAGAADILREYIDNVDECCALLRNRKGEKLYAELSRWAEKFFLCAEVLNLCYGFFCTQDVETGRAMLQKMEEYNRMPETLTDFSLRETVDTLARGLQ